MSNQQKSKPLFQLFQQQQLSFEDRINEQQKFDDQKHSYSKKINQAILNLYQECRDTIVTLKDQQLICISRNIIPLESESSNIDPLQMIAFIQKILQNLFIDKKNIENQLELLQNKEQSDYEAQLQKLEAEIRQHIRIEQQLKLFAENTQQKLEDVTKIKEELEQQLQILQYELKQENDQNEQTIKNYQREIQCLNFEISNFKNLSLGKQTIPTQMLNENNSKPIMINLHLNQVDKNKKTVERVQTEPQQLDFMDRSKQSSQQKLYQGRVQTENSEQQKTKKRQNNYSYFDTNSFQQYQQLKKQLNQTKQKNTHNSSSLNADKKHHSNKENSYYQLLKIRQDTKRQQSQSQLIIILSKCSQYSADMSRSNNNSLHSQSFRGLNKSRNQNNSFTNVAELQAFPRPFSSTDQQIFSEDQNSYLQQEQGGLAEASIELNLGDFYGKTKLDHRKQTNELCDNKQQIKMMISNYQLKQNENQPPKKQLARNGSRETKKKSNPKTFQ